MVRHPGGQGSDADTVIVLRIGIGASIQQDAHYLAAAVTHIEQGYQQCCCTELVPRVKVCSCLDQQPCRLRLLLLSGEVQVNPALSARFTSAP